MILYVLYLSVGCLINDMTVMSKPCAWLELACLQILKESACTNTSKEAAIRFNMLYYTLNDILYGLHRSNTPTMPFVQHCLVSFVQACSHFWSKWQINWGSPGCTEVAHAATLTYLASLLRVWTNLAECFWVSWIFRRKTCHTGTFKRHIAFCIKCKRLLCLDGQRTSVPR